MLTIPTSKCLYLFLKRQDNQRKQIFTPLVSVSWFPGSTGLSCHVCMHLNRIRIIFKELSYNPKSDLKLNFPVFDLTMKSNRHDLDLNAHLICQVGDICFRTMSMVDPPKEFNLPWFSLTCFNLTFKLNII